MAAAQRAVEDAANALPDDVGERLADADRLTDADREKVTAAARQALAAFLLPAQSNPVPRAAGPG